MADLKDTTTGSGSSKNRKKKTKASKGRKRISRFKTSQRTNQCLTESVSDEPFQYEWYPVEEPESGSASQKQSDINEIKLVGLGINLSGDCSSPYESLALKRSSLHSYKELKCRPLVKRLRQIDQQQHNLLRSSTSVASLPAVPVTLPSLNYSQNDDTSIGNGSDSPSDSVDRVFISNPEKRKRSDRGRWNTNRNTIGKWYRKTKLPILSMAFFNGKLRVTGSPCFKQFVEDRIVIKKYLDCINDAYLQSIESPEEPNVTVCPSLTAFNNIPYFDDYRECNRDDLREWLPIAVKSDGRKKANWGKSMHCPLWWPEDVVWRDPNNKSVTQLRMSTIEMGTALNCWRRMSEGEGENISEVDGFGTSLPFENSINQTGDTTMDSSIGAHIDLPFTPPNTDASSLQELDGTMS